MGADTKVLIWRKSLCPKCAAEQENPCVREDAENSCLLVVYKRGIKCQAVSLKTNLPFLMLKACCVLWHGLRPKAEHHLPGPVMNCMCNKNVGGGVPLTSGDVICLSLTEPVLGCSICYLHRTKVNLYWYVKRLQHKIRCCTGKQQLRVSTFGCTLSKSHILV